MTARYVYSPLNPSQIRLSVVTKIDDVLSISLAVVDFDVAPAYITLSYCWEGQEQDNVVICDGRELNATRNVVAMLNYLAITYPHHWFWIDAVCINQDNDIEKDFQISMMNKIYEKALRTVAWIGRMDEDIAATIQDLPNMFTKAQDYVGEPLGSQAHWTAYGILTSLPSVWFGLYKILLQPWFGRLWVIQEVILSKEVILVCGESVVDERFLLPLTQKYLRFALACINEVTLPMGNLWQGLSCFSNVCRQQKQWQASTFQSPGLPELLSMTEDFLVSNPRDRIYALLGIISPFWQKSVRVTYEIPITEVYINFATI